MALMHGVVPLQHQHYPAYVFVYVHVYVSVPKVLLPKWQKPGYLAHGEMQNGWALIVDPNQDGTLERRWCGGQQVYQ